MGSTRTDGWSRLSLGLGWGCVVPGRSGLPLTTPIPHCDACVTMKKRSVLIAGHPTSVSLEEEFWDALKTVAQSRGLSVNALIEEIDQTRAGNLSSAIRVHVLKAVQGRGE